MDDKSTRSANTTEVAGKATEKLRPHLLIVDDDRELCEVLKRYLEAEDFRVSFVHTGDAGVKAGIEGSFELIVLDVMLPDKKGFNVLKDIRQRTRTPVVMLTARGEEFDRILGLELGADDYLAKPFNPRELAARISAILRRSGWHASWIGNFRPSIEASIFTLPTFGASLAHSPTAARGFVVFAPSAISTRGPGNSKSSG